MNIQKHISNLVQKNIWIFFLLIFDTKTILIFYITKNVIQIQLIRDFVGRLVFNGSPPERNDISRPIFSERPHHSPVIPTAGTHIDEEAVFKDPDTEFGAVRVVGAPVELDAFQFVFVLFI